MSGTEQRQFKWTFGARFIPDIINRAKWRNTLTYQLTSRLSIGVEYNPLAKQASPLANFVAVTETKNRPALILGTSSDRIGTPSGQSVYATFSKNLKRETGLPIAPYVGAAYGSFDNRVRIIGGVNVSFTDEFSSTVLFDGVRVHPLLNYTRGRHQFGFVLANARKPGLSYSVSF